jgi:hypothetical protein
MAGDRNCQLLPLLFAREPQSDSRRERDSELLVMSIRQLAWGLIKLAIRHAAFWWMRP